MKLKLTIFKLTTENGPQLILQLIMNNLIKNEFEKANNETETLITRLLGYSIYISALGLVY